jgi:hypothetical protein
MAPLRQAIGETNMRQITLSALAAVSLAAAAVSPVFANPTYHDILNIGLGGPEAAEGEHQPSRTKAVIGPGQYQLPNDRGVCGQDEQMQGSLPYAYEPKSRDSAAHDPPNDQPRQSSVPIDFHAKRKETVRTFPNREVEEHMLSDVAAAKRMLRHLINGASI